MKGVTTDQLLYCMHSWTWSTQRIPLIPPTGPAWRVQATPRPYGVTVILTVFHPGEPWQDSRHILTAEMLRAKDSAAVNRMLNKIVAGLFRRAGVEVPLRYEPA